MDRWMDGLCSYVHKYVELLIPVSPMCLQS